MRYYTRNGSIIYLECSVEESIRRIKRRNRDCEKEISVEYITALKKSYDDFIKFISKSIPVIKVNWEEFKSADEIAKKIYNEYLSMYQIRTIN